MSPQNVSTKEVVKDKQTHETQCFTPAAFYTAELTLTAECLRQDWGFCSRNFSSQVL